MKQLLVIEDGDEYAQFARALYAGEFVVHQAKTAAATLAILQRQSIDALLIDLRFDFASPQDLIGDVVGTASSLFGGDTRRAVRYLQDQQGVLILAELRKHGYPQPAVFVHDFPERRLQNLRKLYGQVTAVPAFDAAAIRRGLQGVR